MKFTTFDSPVGELLLVGDDEGLAGLYLPGGKNAITPDPSWVRDEAAFTEVASQLKEYFAGTRQEFDLTLNPVGSKFQRQVWEALLDIPYGETASYGQTAAAIGHPNGSRAVGAANGQNPIAIIVPCHRVIGANGSLTGYGGGLPMKKWLLAHEAKNAGLTLL